MELTIEFLKKLLNTLKNTEDVEIGCDECFEELDRFAELQLAGKNAAEALPLVQAHLEKCQNCREEYEALLAALQQL